MDWRILVPGIFLFLFGGGLFLYTPVKVVPYPVSETYIESVPYTGFEAVEIKDVVEVAEPVMKPETVTKTEYDVIPYVSCGYSCWSCYPYCCPRGCYTYYKTVSKKVTETEYVLTYQEKNVEETTIQIVPVTKYRDVEKTRLMTEYRKEREYWPQYLGLIFFGFGLAFFVAGALIE